MKTITQLGNEILLNDSGTEQEREFYAAFGYHGCGKAWAAIRNGEVVALSYMGGTNQRSCKDYTNPPYPNLPAKEGLGLYFDRSSRWPLNIGWRSNREKAELVDSAVHLGLISDTKTNGANVSRATLMSRLIATLRAEYEIWLKWETECFEAWRTYSRTKLSEFGDLTSGVCSCHEFIAKDGTIYKA
jgi:hypothetical protein